jgi:hypothetical protein
MSDVHNASLDGETIILTANGPAKISILVGQTLKVLSINKDNKLLYRYMTNIHHSTLMDEMLTIELNGGNTIRCTKNQVFYLSNGLAVEASDLLPGMKLSTFDLRHQDKVNEIIDINQTSLLVRLVTKSAPRTIYSAHVEETGRFYIKANEFMGILLRNTGN